MRKHPTKVATPDLPRRAALKKGAAIGAALIGAPWVARYANAQGMDLGPYLNAKINWRQVEGQTVNAAVIPASYFDNLIALTPEFEALTGIKVRYDKVPPGQIRQKVVLDMSSKTGNISTHAGDPMYIPLYAANKWADELEPYLNDSKLTDKAWFKFEDIFEAWRKADMVNGKTYALPYNGEMTIQTYRKDLYDAKGLKPADTLDQIVSNAKAIHNPAARMWGFCLRGMPGAGQNMYIYPSILGAYGGKWFDTSGKIKVNSPEAVAALEWYVNTNNTYGPQAAQNWNWPDIADAFAQGTIGCYIDGHSAVTVIANPERSKVTGKIGFARWPKGPSGHRVSSIWNWAMPINSAMPEKARQATWLYIQWAASEETQARTSYKFKGPGKRFDLNRLSMWKNPEYLKTMEGAGSNFVNASIESLTQDTDVEWRPRVPQWPAIGETMAKIVQSALVGQVKPKAALDDAQIQVERIMRGG
jgi:ABC-type glycerol-3-phosphate transport system substrate-binding protein